MNDFRWLIRNLMTLGILAVLACLGGALALVLTAGGDVQGARVAGVIAGIALILFLLSLTAQVVLLTWRQIQQPPVAISSSVFYEHSTESQAAPHEMNRE